MEICALRTDHSKAPVSGQTLYVVIDESHQQVSLFHPWSLTEFTLPREEYVQARKEMYWPVATDSTEGIFDVKKVVKAIEDRVQFFTQQKRAMPIRTITRCLAALKGISVSDVEKSVTVSAMTETKKAGSREVQKYQLLKKPASFAKLKGRRKEILDFLMKGPATVAAISEAIKYVPKLKVAQDLHKAKEREIMWTLRQDLIKKGFVKAVE